MQNVTKDADSILLELDCLITMYQTLKDANPNGSMFVYYIGAIDSLKKLRKRITT